MNLRRIVPILLLCLLAPVSLAWAEYLGDFPTGATVHWKFTTNSGAGARVDPSSAWEAADLRCYKNGSTTERSSTAGYTITSTFDTMTGVTHVSVDTNDNTDAGFWAASNEYQCVLYPDETVDGQSVAAVSAMFSIERSGGALALIKARLPNATPGAAGGVFIAGTNAPVTITGSGAALTLSSTGGNGQGLLISGNGTGAGVQSTGGATGPGMKLVGGATSGEGLLVNTTSGDGIKSAPTAGDGLNLVANGSNKHGLRSTGGTAGVSHGAAFIAGTGGVDLNAATGITVDACTGCSTAGGTILMPALGFVKGSTSVIVDVWIKDTTTNVGKTGLTSASAGLTLAYCRVDQGNAACSTFAPASTTRGTYTSGGFVEKDATNAPGTYELGLPTAALASGADWVDVWVLGVSGTAPTKLHIDLVDVGLNSIYSRIGPPAGANLAGDVAAVKTDTAAIKSKTDSLGFTASNVNAHIKATDSPLTVDINGSVASVTALSSTALNALADSVWDEAIAGHLAGGTTGNALNAAGSAGDPWSTPIPGAYGAGTAGKLVGDMAAQIPNTLPELTQGIPPVTPTLAQAIMALYMALRNQTQTTSGTIKYTNDSGTVIFKCNLADDGTTFTKSECIAGP